MEESSPKWQWGCNCRFVSGVESERDLEMAQPGASGFETEFSFQRFLWDRPWVKVFSSLSLSALVNGTTFPSLSQMNCRRSVA